MKNIPFSVPAVIALACTSAFIGACGGSDDGGVAPVVITVAGPNVVSQWDEIAATTINQPAAASGTPEEQRPTYATDLATVHLAMYDAVMAIVGTHKPYAYTPASLSADASQEAAVATAAYRTLLGLFPARGASYQSAYDTYLASLPAGAAKDQGVAIGTAAATAILALRANDGRAVVLAPYVPGTEPGQFRGLNPINRYVPSIKPFAVDSNSQFRAPGPVALTSATYAADVNETMALGSAASTTRTAAQTETARFHTEPPPLFWSRNIRQFAMTAGSIAEHARLMALLWVVQSDAINTCFESKYFHQTWRPTSAIQLADTDGNAATTPDPTWAPVVPTPNHPEYPAAHACNSASVAAALGGYYRTSRITFDFNSSVTSSTHTYDSTQAFVDEIAVARIAG
ncbi:MAG: vanadium-dependent haloperoxidase, partial [Solirubrobacteraceae bacterium]|nr:vanadium-dependent haloperoxidase [Solirubrobacteraceae bacterium]